MVRIRGAVRRTVPLVAAVVAAGVLLAACGGGLAPRSGGGSSSRSGPVSTKVPSGKVTLTLAFVDAPDMVKQLIAMYHKQHPNVTIKPQYTQFNDYVKNIKLTMSSNTAPDIAQFNPGAMQSVIAAGLLRDMDPYSKAYGWKSKVPPVSLEQLSTDKTGKVFGTGSLYAVPVGLSLVGVFYNKKEARKAGITAPPKTFAEFEADLAKAKQAGELPLQVGGLDTGTLHLWAELLNVNMPLSRYRTWVYGQKGGDIKTPGAKAATEKVREWAQRGYIAKSANGTSENDSAAKFQQGKGVFHVNGNWAAGDIAKNMKGDAGFFAMPPLKAGGLATGNGFSLSYAVSGKSKHADVAANFLDFLYSPQAAKVESANGFLPANPKAVAKPAGVLGDLNSAYQQVAADNGIQQFPDASAPKMLDTIESGLQSLIAGRMTSDAYLDSVQKTWTDYHK